VPTARKAGRSIAPLYHRIEADLRRRLRAGEFPTGAALPTEHELTRWYDVSRHTVRMALGRLHADGLIDRGAGRGTFVRPQTDRVRFYLDRSFTQQMAELGVVATSRVLRRIEDRIKRTDPEAVRAHVGEPCLRLSRLRLGGDQPIGVQHTIVLTRRCRTLARHDFASESLYAILAREYGLVAREIEHAVSGAVAGARERKLLGTRAGEALVVVNTTALLDDGQVLEYTASRYRADRYEYRTRHVFAARTLDAPRSRT
jgi:GntR family transcriptional regulator